MIVFVFMLIVCTLIQAEVIQRHLLILPENNQLSFGISPKMWDKNAMEENALSQACVLFTRMDSAFSIDKFLSIQKGGDSDDIGESAQLQYNVVSDLDKLKMNYQSLVTLYNQEIYGYYLAFFAHQEIKEQLLFKPVEDDILNDELPLRKEENTIFTFGRGKSTKLDDALDIAFDKAMFEYSKYMGQEIKSLQKEENEKSWHIYERNAVNQIHQLEFSRVLIEVIKNDSVIEYQVKAELRKRKINE